MVTAADIWFILVYKSNLNSEKHQKLLCYLQNLHRIGLETETAFFVVDRQTSFLKICSTNEFYSRYSFLLNSQESSGSSHYTLPPEFTPNFMVTPLTESDSDNSTIQRAMGPVTGDVHRSQSSAEKILIVEEVLKRVKFGEDYGQYSYVKLLEENILIDAFPLHDGDYKWSEEGQLNDRQLLSKFWGNISCWYKAQPRNLIEKYYGSEYGFYYAWFGHYIKMLFPIGVLSLICVAYGIFTIRTDLNPISTHICGSNLTICPICPYDGCYFYILKEFCVESDFVYILDNPVTLGLAFIVTLWSTVVMELWKRLEAEQRIRWNIRTQCHQNYIRPQYFTTRKQKISNKKIDQHNTSASVIARYTVTSTLFILLIFLIILAMFTIILYRVNYIFMWMKYSGQDFTHMHAQLFANISSAFTLAVLISFLRLTFGKISFWLTCFENHRSQQEFETSLILKNYILDFTNSYSVFFYTAFIRGRFFTHPGNLSHWENLGGIEADICDPTGCIGELGIQLFFVFFIRLLFLYTQHAIKPIIKRMKTRKILSTYLWEGLKNYEQEYLLEPVERYYIDREMADLVIQYGYVIFFVVACPPAPALALCSNIIELRIDASKMTKNNRRPIPRQTWGLGIWLGILQMLTYIGIVTNGLVIAFSSEFVPGFLYHRHNNEVSYINTTLSAYIHPNTSEICYYPGKRYPPNHPHQYKLSPVFWKILFYRLMVLIIFEHICCLINGILAYAIPDTPTTVQEKIQKEERQHTESLKKMKLNE